MSNASRITVAYGDGIGFEIMKASLHIIPEAGARLETKVSEIGEKVYLSGNSATLRNFDRKAGYTLAQGQ